jgi:DMSO/TMAO reductase YedYZ molybdopterin-dependent catalytic subunit
MAVSTDSGISMMELRLAARNHAMLLEALDLEITPIGLHYLLTHYDVPIVDLSSWSLRVGGLVDRPLALSLPDLKALGEVDLTVTMECAGNGRAFLEPRPISQPWLTGAVGTARWTGTPLEAVLHEAGVGDEGVDVVFGALDRGIERGVEQAYERSLSVEEAVTSGAIIASRMNGEPLPPQHGFPARLVVPGWYGMTNVKWLSSIDVIDYPFDGYQVATSYRFRQDEDESGRPVTLMRPRSLMVPPGIANFPSGERTVESGRVELRGRAWSGRGPIVKVEVSHDDGATWSVAVIDQDQGDPWAWRGWSFEWEALTPGSHILCCRATDASGDIQPDQPEWNVGGYENNAIQRVTVTVR